MNQFGLISSYVKIICILGKSQVQLSVLVLNSYLHHKGWVWTSCVHRRPLRTWSRSLSLHMCSDTWPCSPSPLTEESKYTRDVLRYKKQTSLLKQPASCTKSPDDKKKKTWTNARLTWNVCRQFTIHPNLRFAETCDILSWDNLLWILVVPVLRFWVGLSLKVLTGKDVPMRGFVFDSCPPLQRMR